MSLLVLATGACFELKHPLSENAFVLFVLHTSTIRECNIVFSI